MARDAWRSDTPITVDRWIAARHLSRFDEEDFAAALQITIEELADIEAGRTQPPWALQLQAALVTGVRVAWFHLAPLPSLGPNSSQWHDDWRVCDRCEQEEGSIAPENEWAYRAERVCAVCALDLCEIHWEERDGRILCDVCAKKERRKEMRPYGR